MMKFTLSEHSYKCFKHAIFALCLLPYSKVPTFLGIEGMTCPSDSHRIPQRYILENVKISFVLSYTSVLTP